MQKSSQLLGCSNDYLDTAKITGDLISAMMYWFVLFFCSRNGSGSNSLEAAIWALSTLRGQESRLAEETPGGFQTLCSLFRLGIRFQMICGWLHSQYLEQINMNYYELDLRADLDAQD